MSDPKKDVAPEPDLVEEDDEPSLPDADEAAAIQIEEAPGSLAAGRDAIVHAIKEAPSRPGVYRMIDGRGDVLYVGKAKNIKKRIAAYARPTGLDTRIERMIAQTRDARVRRHPHRDRGAAAGSQPDQAAAAAVQRHAARRQIVSLYPDHLGPLGAANLEAPRRALAAGPVLRPVRLGVGGQPHRQRLAARIPVALVQRSVLRKPHAAVSALSDQALLGAVHQADRVQRLCRFGARGQCVPVRPQQDGQRRARRGNGESVHGARFRARRDLPRSALGAVGDPIAAGHQSAHGRGGRRLCRASAGRLHLRRGVLLPHRAELGQPRLFSQGRQIAGAGRSAVGASWRNFTTTSRRRVRS